jgi:hypothetical protein
VTCSVPDVRFLWHRGRGHGHCGTSIATFRSEPLLTATVAQPSDLQQRPVVQSTGTYRDGGLAALARRPRSDTVQPEAVRLCFRCGQRQRSPHAIALCDECDRATDELVARRRPGP